jgi:CRISPR-associated protein Csb2
MLVIELAFPAGRYHATAWGRHVNEGVPEWPPAPYRLVRALYDAWKRKRPDWADSRVERVLDAISSASPSYRLPAATASHTRSFLSKNEHDPQSKTLICDGFVVLCRRATVLMGWPDISTDSATLDDLDELLSVLNYLGRSESWVAARVMSGVSGVEWNCFPDSGDLRHDEMDVVPVAVPIAPLDYKPVTHGSGKTAKQLTWMDAISTGTDSILKQGWSHPPAMRYVDYLRRADCFDEDPSISGDHREQQICSVLYAFDSKVLPQVTETLEIAERAQVRLMGIHKSLAGGPEYVSRKFSGKNESGDPLAGHQHAFYFPIDQNGDGRLDHMLVFCRTPFNRLERLSLDRLEAIWQHDGKPEIRCIPVQWAARRNPSKIIASTTPFVPTRHYKPKLGDFGAWLRGEITRECANHELPAPVRVTGLKELLVRGSRSIRWFEFRRNRKDSAVNSGFGLQLEFDQPVEAPLALGYGCHFGLGQFQARDD